MSAGRELRSLELVLYDGERSKPMRPSASDAARIGPGQRTTAVPTRRHPRVFIFRLGSSSPNRLAEVIRAGAMVSAAATATSIPIARGTPSVWKYGSRVKLRQ